MLPVIVRSNSFGGGVACAAGMNASNNSKASGTATNRAFPDLDKFLGSKPDPRCSDPD